MSFTFAIDIVYIKNGFEYINQISELKRDIITYDEKHYNIFDENSLKKLRYKLYNDLNNKEIIFDLDEIIKIKFKIKRIRGASFNYSYTNLNDNNCYIYPNPFCDPANLFIKSDTFKNCSNLKKIILMKGITIENDYLDGLENYIYY